MAFHPIDQHVGLRLRQRRALLGMSQTALGVAVGLTFQQVQKYERGANRISASRLVEFARVLDVPPDYFFEGLPAGADSDQPGRKRGDANRTDVASGPNLDPMIKRETLELVRAYYKIRAPSVRKRIFETVKALGTAMHGVSATHGKAQRKPGPH